MPDGRAAALQPSDVAGRPKRRALVPAEEVASLQQAIDGYNRFRQLAEEYADESGAVEGDGIGGE